MTIVEKYRPQRFSDIVAQDKALRQIELLRPRGLGGRAYWLCAPSGTGKTTLAYLLAAEVANREWGVDEADASAFTPKDVTDWERKITSRSCFAQPTGWALIVNEAHGLRQDTIRQLLLTLERLPDYCLVVFTAPPKGQLALFDKCDDTPALISRCIVLAMREKADDEFDLLWAQRLKQIAIAEQLDGKPIEDYLRLFRRHRHNPRACLQAIETGEMLA